MAKHVTQFRYYGNTAEDKPNPKNNVTKLALNNGSFFTGNIIQLGIQTIPGVQFALNNGLTYITIGSTGIYELDLDGVTQITKIAFESKSLNLINKTNNGYLIIDIIYEE